MAKLLDSPVVFYKANQRLKEANQLYRELDDLRKRSKSS